MATQTATQGQRFTNVQYPWETIVAPAPADAPIDPRTKMADPAYRRTIRFANGVFWAREPWQIAILKTLPHVHEDDSPVELAPCPICQFTTRSTKALVEHMAKHAQ